MAEKEKSTPLSVVGIGASAGGLEALNLFFDNMPRQENLAFVVIQHLSPDYKSLMLELLSKHTDMPIYRVEDGMSVEPASIYLIPPKKNLTIFHGKLYLSEHDSKQVLNLPIDIFFRSLAQDQGERSIGIILSGTGSDGTRGIRAIKEAGGMVMVQDETSAKFDGMPKSAIITGLVDFILPPQAMPGQLIQYIQNPFPIAGNKPDEIKFHEEGPLAKVFLLLRNQIGVDFTYYKPSTVIRRIERRMSVHQIEKLDQYTQLLNQSTSEIKILFRELLIGVTKFFRDPEAFEILGNRVIPKLFEETPAGQPMRVWVSACSTGEEAYSLAIILKEYMHNHKDIRDIKIFATDIDRDAVEFASMGVYPESIAADIHPDRMKHFFIAEGDNYQVIREIREMMIFAPHNLIKDPPFNKMDLVTCRNFLIYLQPMLQKKVLSYFHFALNPKRYLFLGSSETIGDMTDHFVAFDHRWKIYTSSGGPRTPLQATIETHLPAIDRKPSFNGLRITAPRLPAYDKFQNQLTQMVISEFMPPAVVVNEDFEMVLSCGGASDYLRVPKGQISLNILKMTSQDLSIPLSTGLHKVFKENQPLEYKDIRLKEKGKVSFMNLKLTPFMESRSKQRMAFIEFQVSRESVIGDEQQVVIPQDTDHQRIDDLEQELQYTKENLQATIEELETSNEELQATNEELLSANEELQSTNEELQSVNEELITVNSEYQSKIQELIDLNNDIENLLSSTNIGTIFLDSQLRIRKFTPSIREVVNLIDSDVGRPINHISSNLKYENIVEDAKKVLRDLTPYQREVQNLMGRWYLKRIFPYRTMDDAIKGVVITFVDITELKKAIAKVAMLSTAVEQSPIIVVITDLKTKIQYVNPGFSETTGYDASEAIGKTPALLKSAYTPQETFKSLWATLKNGEKWSGTFCNRKKDGELYWEQATVAPIKGVDGEIVQYLKIGEDITEKRRAEEERQKQFELLSQMIDNAPTALCVVSNDGHITFANTRAEKLLGLKKDQLSARTYDDPTWKSLDTDGNPIASEDLPFSIICRTKKPLEGYVHSIVWPDGKRILLRMSGTPVLDKNQHVSWVVFTLELIEA